MSHSVFIAGTDTGVGKTRIAAALVYRLARQGLRAVGMKPVASGCPDPAVLCEDVAQLVAASNVTVPIELVNPYRFPQPVAPHLAAELAGREIAFPSIVTAHQALLQQADWVVVEGVGGLLVPLNATQDSADLAKLLELPVVLVVGMRLGCVNHALLTVLALQQRGLKLSGWVANCIDSDMLLLQQNIATLQQRIAAPLLGVVPWQADENLAAVAACLDVQPLLAEKN